MAAESASATQSLNILVLEENPEHLALILNVLTGTQPPAQISLAKSEADAIKLLREEGIHAPQLVLVSLDVFQKGAHELFEEIRKNPELQRTPVLLLNTNGSQLNLLNTYYLRINCYICRLPDLADFLKVIRHLENLG